MKRGDWKSGGMRFAPPIPKRLNVTQPRWPKPKSIQPPPPRREPPKDAATR
jgi:hypothetical protein